MVQSSLHNAFLLPYLKHSMSCKVLEEKKTTAAAQKEKQLNSIKYGGPPKQARSVINLKPITNTVLFGHGYALSVFNNSPCVI